MQDMAKIKRNPAAESIANSIIENYKCEIERDNYIKNNLDRKLIVIDDFKYSKYVWSGGIDNNYFGRYYNLYHGYDENIRYFVRGGMNND